MIVVLVSLIVASKLISDPEEFVSLRVITLSTLSLVRAVSSVLRIGSVREIVIVDDFETPEASLAGLNVASGGTDGV